MKLSNEKYFVSEIQINTPNEIVNFSEQIKYENSQISGVYFSANQGTTKIDFTCGQICLKFDNFMKFHNLPVRILHENRRKRTFIDFKNGDNNCAHLSGFYQDLGTFGVYPVKLKMTFKID